MQMDGDDKQINDEQGVVGAAVDNQDSVGTALKSFCLREFANA